MYRQVCKDRFAVNLLYDKQYIIWVKSESAWISHGFEMQQMK